MRCSGATSQAWCGGHYCWGLAPAIRNGWRTLRLKPPITRMVQRRPGGALDLGASLPECCLSHATVLSSRFIAASAEWLAHGGRAFASAVVTALLHIVFVGILRPGLIAVGTKRLVEVACDFVAATDAVSSAALPGCTSLWLRNGGCRPETASLAAPRRMPQPILFGHRDEGFADFQSLLIAIGV